MDSSQAFSDEHVRTQMKVIPFDIQSYRQIGQQVNAALNPVVTTLRALAPQFGYRMEQADPPAFIATPEAAKVYSELKLNQWNSEALTSSVDVIPQLRMGPNRPIEVTEGPYVATLRSVDRTLNWDGLDMSQTVGLNYTRVWSGLFAEDGKTLLYEPLGGFASRPLNYGLLFRRRQPASSSAARGPG
jgi:hypothetical protein